MYREELKHKQLTPLQGVLVVIGIVAAVMAALLIGQFAAYLLNTKALSYVVFAVALVAAVWIVRGRLQDYAYELEAGRLRCCRMLGENKKTLLEISLKQAVWLGNVMDLPQKYAHVPRARATFHKRNRCMSLVYGEAESIKQLIFSPSEALCERIHARILKNQADEQRHNPDAAAD